MAGMGPPPKDPRLRQRTNKTSTHALLPPEGSERLSGRKVPALPDRECPNVEKACQYCAGTGVLPWHELAIEFWAAAWRSPMSVEWAEADIPGLFVLADLMDRYWRGDAKLAPEIRLQRQQYGLDSLARRRLQWEIGKVEDAERRRPQVPVQQPTRRNDPRKWLRAVK